MMVSLPTHICVTRPQRVQAGSTGNCPQPNIVAAFGRVSSRCYLRNHLTYVLRMLGRYMSRLVHKGWMPTVYPKKYAHGFCFAVLCCGYTLTDFPISTRLTSLALGQSLDCPSAGKATLMNMDKYFMWNHYERLHNHNKAKHNKTVCIFIGKYCRKFAE